MQAEAALPLPPDVAREPDPLAPRLLPLVLDLDGTLLRSDMLWEGVLAYLRPAPWRIVRVAALMLRGRAALKAHIAQAVAPNLEQVPANEELVALAEAESAAGRPVHLATAADWEIGIAAAKRFPFIEEIFASDGATNLKGGEKAARLVRAFPEGFLYAGDSRADLPVWRAASGIVLAGASASVERAARTIREPLAVFPRPARLAAALRLMRPHQWAKNGLVAVPLALGGSLEPAAFGAVLLAFVALCLVASATYIVNDLADLSDDRRHWSKRERPLASGALPIPHGVALCGTLMAAGLGLGALAGVGVLAGIIAYVAATLAYSLCLKRIPLVDVTTLAGLFTLRLGIGVAAAGVALSPWLLTFSMFLFLSLSLAKRHTELARAALAGAERPPGRGYAGADEPLVLALGVGSLVAGVLVFVLYLTQEAFVAAHLAAPKLLWVFPPALFLLAARIWLLSGRGELDDDPVAFAVRDRASLATIAALGAVFLAAWAGVPAL